MEENKEKGRKKEPISWPAGPRTRVLAAVAALPGLCLVGGCRNRAGSRWPWLTLHCRPHSLWQDTAATAEAESPLGLRIRGCTRPCLTGESNEGLEPPGHCRPWSAGLLSQGCRLSQRGVPEARAWRSWFESKGGLVCGQVKKMGFWGTTPQGRPDRWPGEPTVGSAPASEVSPGGPRRVGGAAASSVPQANSVLPCGGHMLVGAPRLLR